MSRASIDRLGWIGRIARALSCGLLGYWALFAVVTPVTTWDAHVYNLARLPVAELGGILNNPFWTSERQLMFPITFDAVHLPLLHLGAAYGLPSFLCFVGTLVVVWITVSRWHGRDAGWLAVLVLLGLPTLVFQAVLTKNDVAVLFGIAAWWHAMMRWRDDGQRVHLLFAALAIGFMAGAKSSGLSPALFCSVATVFVLRKSGRSLVWFAPMLLSSLVLLGSVETYVATTRRFGGPFGPEQMVRDHRNNDGVRGAAANVLRYTMANLSTGFEPVLMRDPVTPWCERQCRRLLSRLGLANAGYRPDFDDNRLVFLRNGTDVGSDFGPLGTLCIALAFLSLVWWRPNEAWWRLAAAAILVSAALCYTVAWMPWNNRFLMVPFVLLAIGLVSILQRQGLRLLNAGLLVIAAYGAVVYPLTSYNKRPADLIGALSHRDEQEFKERSTMQPVNAAVRDWRARHPNGEVLLIAGTDSWVLPILRAGPAAVHPISTLELETAIRSNLGQHIPTLVFVLDRPDFHASGFPLVELARFPEEPGTALYTPVSGADLSAKNQVVWREGRFEDGWTACQFVIGIDASEADALELDLWNPTELKRTVRLKSKIETAEVELSPQARRMIRVRIKAPDSIQASVSPPFSPGGADNRELGIRVDVPRL